MKIKKADILIYLFSALIAVGVLLVMLFFRDKGDIKKAVIEADGKEYATLTLPCKHKEFSVNGVTIVAEGEEIWVESSDCPDKTCVKTGKLDSVGERATCLPNRVTVYITGENAPDVTVG